MRKFLIIEISENEDGILPGVLDHTEALFNFGIGAPENDGEEWPNMVGMAYKVESIVVSDNQPTIHARDRIVVCP